MHCTVHRLDPVSLIQFLFSKFGLYLSLLWLELCGGSEWEVIRLKVRHGRAGVSNK